MNEIENSISFNLNFKYLISLQTEEIETRDREGLAGRVVSCVSGDALFCKR